jgi:hypothetical protein
MKSTPKDPFDYPLRSKKDIMFDHELCPPDFPIKIIRTEYQEPMKMQNVSVSKSDLRNSEVKLELDLNQMGFGPVQLQRIKFLLGNRYRKNNKFKIVVKQFLTYEKNMQRAVDILQQLYWETLRAPSFLWDRMRPKERRKWKIRVFGKTKAERDTNMTSAIEYSKKELEAFEKIADDKSQFTDQAYGIRVQAKRALMDNKTDQDNNKQVEKKTKTKEIDPALTDSEIMDKLQKVKAGKDVLSKKAKEMFGDHI